MFLGLEHTAIASANPEKLAQWYCDHLEFHINFRYDAFFFVKAPNGSMLEIIPAKGDRFDEQPLTPGIRHLAIAVENFDDAYQQLKNRESFSPVSRITIKATVWCFSKIS